MGPGAQIAVPVDRPEDEDVQQIEREGRAADGGDRPFPAPEPVGIAPQKLESRDRAEQDGRGKIVNLTQEGRDFMEVILPPHYLRVSKLMEKLTEDEQKKLIMLLEKLSA